MSLPGDKVPGDRPANDADNLAALKSLILGEEQRQLDHLNKRLDDPQLRAGELAGVLPESLRISGKQDDELTDALEQPVTTCIQRSIERDPDRFADALYPVMGPAIRQSISATLKDLVDNINRTLEHSLSAQGLKWRMEAMRSGVPFAEVVLRHTLAYRVEQVFLIQNDSGLLMQHVHDPLAVSGDADAVSGMLTAIAQFVRDAFQAGDKEGLENVEIGEHTVLLVHGPQAYLACVVRGIPPSRLREHCQGVMETLHRKQHKALASFNGDPDTLDRTRAPLESCLLSEEKKEKKRGGLAPATLFILLLLIAGLAWGGYRWWMDWQADKALHTAQQQFVETLRAQPGIVLTETRFDQQTLLVSGLRDPLAASPAALLQQSGLQATQAELDFHPYLDLGSRFALARARTRLKPPPSVILAISEQGELRGQGVVDRGWIERAELLAPTIPGVSHWSGDGLISLDRKLLQDAREALLPPPGIELEVRRRELNIHGHAPLGWIARIDQRLAHMAELQGLVVQVDADEQLQFDNLLQQLDGAHLAFSEGAVFDDAELQRASEFASGLHRLLALAGQLGLRLQVLVIGRTDGIGVASFNEQLAAARSLSARNYLVQQGLPESLFQLQTAVSPGGITDPALRRADFHIRVDR